MRSPLRFLLTGVVLLAGCAGPLPPVLMHGNGPADPAAPVIPFEPPPNMLALGVEIEIQQVEDDPTHQHGDVQGTSLYVCPMHPAVTADAPGQCPECGMNLTIVEGEHGDVQDTSLYACPMHPAVTAGAPGQCPECGMNLMIKEAR